MRTEISEVLDNIKKINKDKDANYLEAIYFEGYKLLQVDFHDDFSALEKNEIRLQIREIIDSSDNKVKIILYSLLLYLWHDAYDYIEFIKYVFKTNEISDIKTQAFLMRYLSCEEFYYSQVKNDETEVLLWKLHLKVYNQFANQLCDVINKVPAKERNGNLVFVITDQYIGDKHGPTKYVNNIASILIKELKKQVMIVNVAEMMSLTGFVPVYNVKTGSYIEEFLNKDTVKWDGCVIPFYQCENIMPDVDIIRVLINFVANQKPGFIINIGGDSVTQNILARLVPTLAIPLSFDLAYTDSLCQIHPKFDKKSIHMLEEIGKSKSHIIVSDNVSYGLSVPTKIYTRNEMGINDDVFLGVSVSGRIGTDYDHEFWNMINNIEYDKFELLLIGPYKNEFIEQVIEKFPSLTGRIHMAGSVDGVMGYYDMCDIYVNPKRLGGGTSAAEALYSGIPVVTLNYGDISYVAGDGFCVSDYISMTNTINRYISDDDYCKSKALEAKERGKQLFNNKKWLIEAVSKFEKIIAESFYNE